MTAESVLTDLYMNTSQVDVGPPFLATPAEKKQALALLVNSLGQVVDRGTFQRVVLLFLRASGIGSMALEVPEVGAMIRLEALSDGGWSSSSEDLPGSNVDPSSIEFGWQKQMPAVARRCQQWCRERLDLMAMPDVR